MGELQHAGHSRRGVFPTIDKSMRRKKCHAAPTAAAVAVIFARRNENLRRSLRDACRSLANKCRTYEVPRRD